MNRKQLIVLGLLGAAILFGVGKFVFKEEMKVTEKGVEIHESETVNVVIDGPRLSIYSFGSGVENIEWLDDENFLIIGKKDESVENQAYVFHMKDHYMTQYEQGDTSTLDDGYEPLLELADERVICTEKGSGKGLYIQDQGELITLSENVMYQGNRIYTVSERKDKIAYYDAKDQKIRIYGIEHKKTANINVFPDEVILREFQKNLLFAPDSGYVILYYYVPESLQETYFSVFGADSGRSYSDRIWGLDPVWAPEELKVAYLYGEDAERIGDPTDAAKNHGKRLGYYDLKKRKSFYTGAVKNGFEIVSPVKWSEAGDSLGYHTGRLSETAGAWNIEGFHTYDLNEKVFAMEQLEEAYETSRLGDWAFNKGYYWATLESEEQIMLTMIDRTARRLSTIEGCESFNYNGWKTYVTFVQDDLLYKKDGYLYRIDRDKQDAILTRDGELVGVLLAPASSYLSAVSKDEGGYVIDIIQVGTERIDTMPEK